MTRKPSLETIEITPSADFIDSATRPMRLVGDYTDVRALSISLPDTSQHTTLAPEPWSGYVARSDSVTYHALLAAHANSRIIGLDNPGVGGSDLDRKGRALVSQGVFSGVSERQWQSITRLIDRSSEIKTPTAAIGYSLGAAVTAALVANAPEGVRFEQLVLWESVGLGEIVLPNLMQRFVREQPAWGKYKKENPKSVRSLQPSSAQLVRQFYRERGPLLAYGRGSTHATIVPNLVIGRQKRAVDSDTKIVLVSGSDSRVSPPNLNAAAADHLAEEGFNVHQIVLENESHGMIDSLGRVVVLLDHLQKLK